LATLEQAVMRAHAAHEKAETAIRQRERAVPQRVGLKPGEDVGDEFDATA
jgi:hypothetical protein